MSELKRKWSAHIKFATTHNKFVFCFCILHFLQIESICLLLLTRFYTVRYREKDKNKKWILQLCPTTETVVDNLKPNTIYEFGVKDNTDDGIWSKNFIHKVVIPGK